MLCSCKYIQPTLVPMRLKFFVQKFKRYKLPGTHQIRVELIQVEGENLRSEVNKLINSL
jgi:hypothetical protein